MGKEGGGSHTGVCVGLSVLLGLNMCPHEWHMAATWYSSHLVATCWPCGYHMLSHGRHVVATWWSRALSHGLQALLSSRPQVLAAHAADAANLLLKWSLALERASFKDEDQALYCILELQRLSGEAASYAASAITCPGLVLVRPHGTHMRVTSYPRDNHSITT